MTTAAVPVEPGIEVDPPLTEEQVDRAVQLLRPHLDVLREHAASESTG